jgi:hypothetical protein
MVKTSSVTKKPATAATKAAVAVTIMAHKIKKKNHNKEQKKRWLCLKIRLANAQEMLSTAMTLELVESQRFWIGITDDTLKEMRTFSKYRFTNTGKKYGPAECLGCQTGCDASDAHSC